MSPFVFTKNMLFLGFCVALLASGCKPLQQEAGSTVNQGPAFGIPPKPPEPPPPPRAPKTTEGPGWDAVRKALLVPENCYAKNMEFCVKDLDFINPIIQSVLDSRYDGVMPTEPEKIAEVIRSARQGYADALQTPDGRHRIEALVEARFRKPVVTEQMAGKSVTLDLGQLPGKLSIYNFRLWPGDEHLGQFSYWKSTEVAKALKDAVDAYPNAEDITLMIDIPSPTAGNGPHWTYAYHKQRDRLVVKHSGMMRGFQVVDPVGRDLSPYISGEKSLYDNLKWDKSREVNW